MNATAFKIDLHTHSYGSPDGGLAVANYRYFLENHLLDFIAITDHGGVETAQQIQAELADLGERIIVGQEIQTTDGELIGLYLQKTIPAGLTPAQAVRQIKSQKGLVYVPHPFETVRSGISEAGLQAILHDVDIIEVYNGRAVFQSKSKLACATATRAGLARAASSDAHGRFGWGYMYSHVSTKPTRGNLVRQLQNAEYATRKVGMGVLYPKLNRLRKKFGGAK
jgi:predicted metal-dependent phosphoesterase TrpH